VPVLRVCAWFGLACRVSHLTRTPEPFADAPATVVSRVQASLASAEPAQDVLNMPQPAPLQGGTRSCGTPAGQELALLGHHAARSSSFMLQYTLRPRASSIA
jgi:hypothetical protein